MLHMRCTSPTVRTRPKWRSGNKQFRMLRRCDWQMRLSQQTHGVWIKATVSPSSCGQCFSSDSTIAEHSSAEVNLSWCCASLASCNSTSEAFDWSMLIQ